MYTEREIRFLRRWYGVYQVRPGITGWAQVNGRDTVDVYDKVYYDREYVQNVSLKFDLKVLVEERSGGSGAAWRGLMERLTRSFGRRASCC